MKLKFKIADKEVEYDFKHLNIPEKDHGLDDGSLALLMKIDEGLIKSKEGITEKKDLETLKTEMMAVIDGVKKDFNYDKLQEQLNAIFVTLEDKGIKPLKDEKAKKAEERDLNAKWVRALVHKDKDGMKDIEKKLLTYGMEPILHLGAATDEIDSDFTQGGYLIPSMLLAEVNRFVEEGGVARREFRYLPFSGPGNQRYIPTLLTNVTVSWIDEGETKPKTKPTFGRVEQTLKKLAAMVIMTEEIVEDAVIDLVSLCGQLLGEAIAAEEDNQFFSGTGAPWTGILSTAGVVGLACGAGVGPLSMRPETLLGMTVAIPSGAVPGAKFYMNRQIWAAITARRSDAVAEGDARGVYLVQTPGQSSPGTIWGFPVVLVEAMPSVADIYGVTDFSDWDDEATPDADEPFIIFGNLAKCVAYGDKQGVRVKLLDQASVYDENDQLINLAERDMLALRVHKRVGFVVILPSGICILSTGPTS